MSAPTPTVPMPNLSERALLERALIAIEEAMARAELARAEGRPATPAQEALAICLTASAALIDVGQTLLRTQHPAANELAAEWQGVIAHTKLASRSAHQAAVILSAQHNIVAAQQGVLLASEWRSDGAMP